MSKLTQMVVPELGDFSDVEVIEILVSPGDTVSVEDPLITLETDKATMDVPATAAGKLVSIDVSLGDKLNAGDIIGSVDAFESDKVIDADATVVISPEEQAAILAAAAEATGMNAESTAAPTPAPAPTPEPTPAPDTTHFADLVVIGAGPGGYTAAFRAADLGMQVILVERWP
ncbi:MAG: FAD-dependent oxidoreductase, partial [Gammaproteobacteria bacterium]|nr:FAD-dependent oxidoreductase [Gammaproteobacteria bacterium]